MNVHEDKCLHLQLKCQWCERMIKRMNEQQHQEVCEMKVLQCQNQGCNQLLTRAEMNKHISECSYNIVRCEMCSNEFNLKDIQNHKKICDFSIVCCSGCNQTMFKKQQSPHEEICELIEIKCQYCTDVIQRKNWSLHDQISCLKTGQKKLFEDKTQLQCENACLKKDIENLRLCLAQLYEQVQDIASERRNQFLQFLKPTKEN